MDAADFYSQFCDNVEKMNKNIKKKSKNEKTTKEPTANVQQRTFDTVNAVRQHLEEHKKNAISIRDELCEKFGKDEGQRIYRFLKELAIEAANAAGADLDTAIPGVLFTPGGGVFTCIGGRK